VGEQAGDGERMGRLNEQGARSAQRDGALAVDHAEHRAVVEEAGHV
jgi:hypothetical protein